MWRTAKEWWFPDRLRVRRTGSDDLCRTHLCRWPVVCAGGTIHLHDAAVSSQSRAHERNHESADESSWTNAQVESSRWTLRGLSRCVATGRTALDDRSIREVALGGPDTTTRLQNVWQ